MIDFEKVGKAARLALTGVSEAGMSDEDAGRAAVAAMIPAVHTVVAKYANYTAGEIDEQDRRLWGRCNWACPFKNLEEPGAHCNLGWGTCDGGFGIQPGPQCPAAQK